MRKLLRRTRDKGASPASSAPAQPRRNAGPDVEPEPTGPAFRRLPIELIECILLLLEPEDIVIAAGSLPPSWRDVVENSTSILRGLPAPRSQSNAYEGYTNNPRVRMIKCKTHNLKDSGALYVYQASTGNCLPMLYRPSSSTDGERTLVVLDPTKTTRWDLWPATLEILLDSCRVIIILCSCFWIWYGLQSLKVVTKDPILVWRFLNLYDCEGEPAIIAILDDHWRRHGRLDWSWTYLELEDDPTMFKLAKFSRYKWVWRKWMAR